MTFLSVVEAILVFAQATGLRRIAGLSSPASQKINPREYKVNIPHIPYVCIQIRTLRV